EGMIGGTPKQPGAEGMRFLETVEVPACLGRSFHGQILCIVSVPAHLQSPEMSRFLVPLHQRRIGLLVFALNGTVNQVEIFYRFIRKPSIVYLHLIFFDRYPFIPTTQK